MRMCLSTAIVLFVVSFGSGATINKAMFLKNIQKASKVPEFAYNAKINMKMNIQSHIMNDSGSLHFSPPNRNKFELKMSKVKVSSIGDTSWTTMADGSVTPENWTAGTRRSGSGVKCPQCGSQSGWFVEKQRFFNS